MTYPALVAVIGAVEPKLLRALVGHYQEIGVERFYVAFHIPDHADPDQTEQLLATYTALIGPPDLIHRGAFWQRETHIELRDQLRSAAGPGWHLLADSDEFQVYPQGIAEAIRAAEEAEAKVVGGVLLDRVDANGELTDWEEKHGLDASYPLGGFLTGKLVNGSPRKIVLARHTAEMTLGNHRSPGNNALNDPLVPVHHFKWRQGVEEELHRRAMVTMPEGVSTAVRATRSEAQRILDHLAHHDGRIDVANPELGLRAVTLGDLPSWWAAESRVMYRDWQPPAMSTGPTEQAK